MAVEKTNDKNASDAHDEPMLRFKGRQWIIGANVFLMVVLALALLVFADYIAFTFNKKADLTFSGVNSLSEQTRKLLSGLKENVTLVSLYQTFQDPAAENEAKKFRTSVEDLLQLYQTRAPSKIDISIINPAKDRDKILKLVDSLRKKGAYQGEAKKHKAITDEFTAKLAPAIVKLFQDELKQLQAFADTDKELEGVREYQIIMRNCQLLAQQADRTKEDVSALLSDDLPKYSTAVDAIKGLYEQVKTALSTGGEWMGKVDDWGKRVNLAPPKDTKFFSGAPKRYKPLLDQIEAELNKTKDLPTLKVEELDRQVRPDSIIVETKEEAKVLSFEDLWPAKQKGQFGQPIGNTFKDRQFAGETEISSAILQLTEKTKPAVVFVRYGGQPLFFGGMMFGGGEALYAGAKERLEKANFIVKEWDVATKKEPPEFEAKEKPDKIVWILLKPEQPQPPRGMPMQMQQPRPFGPEEREAVLKAIGNNPRVMLIAGWVPPPRNPMMMSAPPIYEYNDWLKEAWGVEVQYSYPVLEGFSFEPGKIGFRRNPFQITRYEFSNQAIVKPIRGLKGVFPEAAPIKKEAKLPEGVTATDLVTIPDRDDIWAESDIEGLSQEIQKQHYTAKGKMDISGPFPIGVAETKTKDGKIAGRMVLISSKDFATDQVALARALVPSGEGFMLVLQNPANMDLLINSVHWLTDNEGLISKGIESRDIPRLDELKPGAAYTAGKILAVGVWPLMALLAGLAVWFVRRR
jgi:hypothetical protein